MNESQKAPLEGELVPVNPTTTGEVVVRDVGLGDLSQLMGVGSVLELHNFDGTPEQRWELASLAVDGEAVKSDKCVNSEVDIQYWYMQRVMIDGKEPGEKVDAIRTVLISPDRTIYSFVSTGIAMAVYRMVSAFGKGPYNPPKKVRIESRALSGGKRMLTFVPVITKQVV